MSVINDETRLDEVLSTLSRLSSTRSGEKRYLSEQNAVARVDAILSEVNGTVLRRLLWFKSESHKLVLDVAERRIHAVSEVAGEWNGGCDDLVGRPLAQSDAADLRSLLSAFAERGEKVEVSIGLPAGPTGFQAEGIALQDVQKTAQDRVTQGFEACHAVAIASVVSVADRETTRTGEADLCTRLDAVRATCSESDTVMIWAGGLAENLAIAVFRTAKFDAAFAFSGDRVPELISLTAGRG